MGSALSDFYNFSKNNTVVLEYPEMTFSVFESDCHLLLPV